MPLHVFCHTEHRSGLGGHLCYLLRDYKPGGTISFVTEMEFGMFPPGAPVDRLRHIASTTIFECDARVDTPIVVLHDICGDPGAHNAKIQAMADVGHTVFYHVKCIPGSRHAFAAAMTGLRPDTIVTDHVNSQTDPFISAAFKTLDMPRFVSKETAPRPHIKFRRNPDGHYFVDEFRMRDWTKDSDPGEVLIHFPETFSVAATRGRK